MIQSVLKLQGSQLGEVYKISEVCMDRLHRKVRRQRRPKTVTKMKFLRRINKGRS